MELLLRCYEVLLQVSSQVLGSSPTHQSRLDACLDYHQGGVDVEEFPVKDAKCSKHIGAVLELVSEAKPARQERTQIRFQIELD